VFADLRIVGNRKCLPGWLTVSRNVRIQTSIPLGPKLTAESASPKITSLKQLKKKLLFIVLTISLPSGKS
jgi:hypothetical protein